jgi:serine/threonine protein kinase
MKKVEKLIGSYKFGKLIGLGAYGKVYKAIHIPTNLFVAIKQIKKNILISEKKERNFFNEVETLKSMKHPLIAEFFDFFETSKSYYIVMEYCPNGNLSHFIQQSQKIEEKNALRLFLQLITALEYLHSVKHIAHRDLKSTNIMLDKNNNIRLIDFGLCKKCESNKSFLHTYCGTAYYMAPEIFQGKPYNTKADIWSLGIILYEMIFGYFPFDSHNRVGLIQEITFEEPIYNGSSDLITNLMINLLQKNPDKRFSLQQILNHEIIQNFPYQQFLTNTLTKVLAHTVEDSNENHNNEDILNEESSINYHILGKEKEINEIKNLNQLDFLQDDINFDEKFPSLHTLRINKRPSIMINKIINAGVLQSSRKSNNQEVHSNQRSRKSIMNQIIFGQHAPLCPSASTIKTKPETK